MVGLLWQMLAFFMSFCTSFNIRAWIPCSSFLPLTCNVWVLLNAIRVYIFPGRFFCLKYICRIFIKNEWCVYTAYISCFYEVLIIWDAVACLRLWCFLLALVTSYTCMYGLTSAYACQRNSAYLSMFMCTYMFIHFYECFSHDVCFYIFNCCILSNVLVRNDIIKMFNRSINYIRHWVLLVISVTKE